VGDSMLPTLTPGRIVVGIRPRHLKIGDIVIVRHEGLEKIKRVKDLLPDRVFIVGDNPGASTDSHQFGWLPTDVVVARILWRG